MWQSYLVCNEKDFVLYVYVGKDMVSSKDVARFIYEIRTLKQVSREGWKLLGIINLESVAAHCLRAVQIGYVLELMEQHDHPKMICTMLVFHDSDECRIGDIHKVASRYVQA